MLSSAQGRQGRGRRVGLLLWKLWLPALCSSMCRLLARKVRSLRGYSPGLYCRSCCGDMCQGTPNRDTPNPETLHQGAPKPRGYPKPPGHPKPWGHRVRAPQPGTPQTLGIP